MKWETIRHELIETEIGYQVILYLPTDREEFGKEFIVSKIYRDMPDSLREYVETLYPALKIHSVKLIAGSLIIGTVLIHQYPQTRVYAGLSNIEQTQEVIQIKMGQYWLQSDVAPVLQDGRVLVPVRFIAEALGAVVQWNGVDRTAIITKGSRMIRLTADDPKGIIDGRAQMLDVPSKILFGRMMVPMRFVSESLGTPVEWDAKNRMVLVNSNEVWMVDYIVKRGDTLHGISKTFRTSIQNLKDWNRITGDLIFEGQMLRVAPPFLVMAETPLIQMVLKEYQFPTVLTYTVKDYATHTSSFRALEKYHAKITDISTFSHKVQLDGSLTADHMPYETISLAKEKKIRSVLLIHNAGMGGFNKALGQEVLASPTARKRLIDAIYSEVKRYGYRGVEVDLEALPSVSRNDYTTLLRELKAKLGPEGLWITVAIPAKTADNPTDNWSGAYDYAAIGKIADRVLIMTYDQNWAGGTPGPVASIGWVEQVARFAASTMPKEKILLGIAAYGYDWPVEGKGGKAVTTHQIKQYIAKYGGQIAWNDAAKSPYYRYKDDKKQERIVWFENAQSAQFKLELAKQYGFQGVGIWRLGQEDQEFWKGFAEKSSNLVNK